MAIAAGAPPATKEPNFYRVNLSLSHSCIPLLWQESIPSPKGRRTPHEKAQVIGPALKEGPAAYDPAMQPYLGPVRARPGCRTEPFPTRKGLITGKGQQYKNYVPDRRTGK